MSIHIDQAIVSAMFNQAQDCYPEESCGFIVGYNLEVESVEGVYYYPCKNTKQTYRERRFLIDPEIYQSVEDQADDAGLSIISIVHSHPDHPDVPSDFDKNHAWPGLSYIIISVAQGNIESYRSWRLSDDRSHFNQEVINSNSAAHLKI